MPIEEVDGKRRVRRPFTRAASRRRHRTIHCGLETEQDLGGSSALQALLRPEGDVVEEG